MIIKSEHLGIILLSLLPLGEAFDLQLFCSLQESWQLILNEKCWQYVVVITREISRLT